jgi:hypothetical protein
MGSVRFWVLGLSIAAGVGLSFLAPASWHVAPFHGALLGSALYLGALRKGKGALTRAAAFVALAATQAYILFETAPGADLRATFVILSTWIVLETTAGAAARGPERRGGVGLGRASG